MVSLYNNRPTHKRMKWENKAKAIEIVSSNDLEFIWNSFNLPSQASRAWTDNGNRVSSIVTANHLLEQQRSNVFVSHGFICQTQKSVKKRKSNWSLYLCQLSCIVLKPKCKRKKTEDVDYLFRSQFVLRENAFKPLLKLVFLASVFIVFVVWILSADFLSRIFFYDYFIFAFLLVCSQAV